MFHLRTILLFFLTLTGSFALRAQYKQADIRALRVRGYKLRYIDTAVSLRLQREALVMASKANEMEEAVVGYSLLSFTYAKDQEMKAAADCADSAYALALKTKSTKALGYANLAMGTLKNILEQPSEAVPYLYRSYDYFVKLKDYSRLSKVTYQLAECLIKTPSAGYYADLSLKYAMMSGKVENIIMARQFYAYLHFIIPARTDATLNFKAQEAIHYYEETIRLIEKDSAVIYTKSNLPVSYYNLAVVIFEHPYPGSDSIFLKLLDKAATYIDQYKLWFFYSNVVGLKGAYYTRKGNYIAAQKLYEDGLQHANKALQPSNALLANFYLSLKKLSVLKNDFKSYYKYDTAYMRYYNLENNDEHAKALIYADVRFQSSQKAAKIKLLETENKMQRTNNWLILGTAILLLLGLLLMIRVYYFKRKYFLKNESLFKERQKTTALQLQLQKQETIEVLTQKLSMERRLLQSQMDPHFVFNALGNIQCFVLQHDVENADAYLSKFSKLMRQVLSHSQKEWIALQDEIDTLKNYIEMQQLRFNHSFEYEIIIDEQVDMRTEIPPMLIQPFIENAIEHGLKPLNPSVMGKLDIHFEESNLAKNLACTIRDNGIGISYSKTIHQHNTNGHQSLATKITRERIDHMKIQNAFANIDIRELKDMEDYILGTEVIIHIPTNN